jgi:hypothetical protein
MRRGISKEQEQEKEIDKVSSLFLPPTPVLPQMSQWPTAGPVIELLTENQITQSIVTCRT